MSPEKVCNKKIRYPSRKAAKKSQKALKRMGKSLRIYECNNCKKWHLASTLSRTVSRLLFHDGLKTTK